MKIGCIKKRTLYTFVLALVVLKPVGIDAFSPMLNLVMNCLKLIAMCYLLLRFLMKIRKKERIDDSILFVLGIEVATVFSNIINLKSSYSTIIYWQGILSLMILADTYSDNDFKKCLDVISLVYKLYVVIDLITIFLWRNGYNNTRLHFLGNKNMHILYILPMMILILYQNAIGPQKKYCLKTCLWWIVSFYIIFMTNSSTSIIAIVLLAIFYVVFYKNRWAKLFGRIKAGFICMIIFALNIIVVFMGATGIFSYFVTNVFGKDFTLTGRIFIWPRAIKMFMENPLGYGWDALVTGVSGNLDYWFGNVVSVGHAHNLMLTIAYKCGIVGLIVFVLYNISLITRFDQKGYFYCLNYDEINVLKMYFYIFMTISILDAYPTNCIGLFFICYLITRLSR